MENKINQGKHISEVTIDKINQLAPVDLLNHGIIRLVDGKTDEYICPFCDNGTGENKSGVKPNEKNSSHVGWKCQRCGKAFNNMAIIAAAYGLDAKRDFVQVVEKACNEFNISLVFDNDKPIDWGKSSTPPAQNQDKINLIHADLATDKAPLIEFVKKNGGFWRGLPADILLKFNCRYIPNWTSPDSRITNKFATPTPRIIVPCGNDSYLARLTVPIESFDDKAKTYIKEKQHTGKKTLFNPDALTATEPVIVVEGYIDALSCIHAGFKAVATGGADAFKLLVDAVKPLKKKPFVIILFDSDATGRANAHKLHMALHKVGCRSVVKFLSNEISKIDCNQILTEQGADYLMNELFAISQEAQKEPADADIEPEHETISEEPPDNNANDNLLEFDSAQKNFLYSGDFSDLDFARRIEFAFPDEFRYLQEENSWLVLIRNNQGGGVWKNRGEKKSVLNNYVQRLADSLIAHAAPAPDLPPGIIKKNKDGSIQCVDTKLADEYNKAMDLHNYQVALGEHLKKQANVSQILEMMKGNYRLIIHTEYLNKHKHLLNVLNGIVNLKSGTFIPICPNYLLTNQAGAAYDANADTTFVEKVFAEIIPDESTRRAVFRYLGYCLTGMKNYHISEFWKGKSGANGKSTLIDFVIKVFGSYAKKLPANGLLENRRPTDGNAPTPAIAQLDGDIRLAIIDELPRNARIDAALFKTLTGDETVYSRAMYCSPRTIELRAKFIINGNHLPTFDVDDGGVLRRINTVAFNQKFIAAKADEKLAEKLATPENRSALLKILVDEARLYYREGLLESDEMKQAKEEYISESDFIGNFLVDNCICGQGGEITRKALEDKLFAAYPRECSRLKKKEILEQIIDRLEPHGAYYAKDGHNKNIFKNIKWLDAE